MERGRGYPTAGIEKVESRAGEPALDFIIGGREFTFSQEGKDRGTQTQIEENIIKPGV